MDWLRTLDLDGLTPSALWSALPAPTREEAARCCYRDEAKSSRHEVDAAVAAAIRFRPTAVRQLPVERRIGYLLKAVHPDDGLAMTLLIALHLHGRGEMLGAFLDSLEIPHEGGVIDEDHELRPPEDGRLRSAVDALLERYPSEDVQVYLASLCAMDPETWGGIPRLAAAR